MKKLFSIAFAFLILLSGMHLSVATHFCGGELAAIKWSFYAEKATCGMDDQENSCDPKTEISSNCCQDQISFYSIESKYFPVSIVYNKVQRSITQPYITPLYINNFTSIPAIQKLSSVLPPGAAVLPNTVNLSEIQVFRI